MNSMEGRGVLAAFRSKIRGHGDPLQPAERPIVNARSQCPVRQPSCHPHVPRFVTQKQACQLASSFHAGPKMASPANASSPSTAETDFGSWLRQLRESKGALQRTVASAADMDPSHLGKVERGERLLTPAQGEAIARFLGADPVDLRIRLFSAKLMQQCDGDHALAHSIGGFVQEQAAPYLVNKSANNRAKKK